MELCYQLCCMGLKLGMWGAAEEEEIECNGDEVSEEYVQSNMNGLSEE